MAVAKKVKIAGIDPQLTISAAQVLLEEMATRTLLILMMMRASTPGKRKVKGSPR